MSQFNSIRQRTPGAVDVSVKRLCAFSFSIYRIVSHLPARRYASAGTSYVCVCLCLSQVGVLSNGWKE